jgi:hypothetical protein
MAPAEHQANDFIPYPIDRVVGTLVDSAQARVAIEALLQRGLDPAHIDILYGESGLHRLDPDGAEHGFWTRFQRTLINTLAVNEESSHLRHHAEDLRAGRIVIMVLVTERYTRQDIGETLSAHGAEHIWFFGKLTMEALDISPA